VLFWGGGYLWGCGGGNWHEPPGGSGVGVFGGFVGGGGKSKGQSGKLRGEGGSREASQDVPTGGKNLGKIHPVPRKPSPLPSSRV